MTGSSASHVQHEVLEVQDDVGDVLGDPVDGVELVERVVEAHLGDRGAGDRRQQRAAQRVAERVAEAGLERADGEPLTVAVCLAERLDGGALNDQHGVLPSLRKRGERGLLGVELDDELLAHGHVDVLAQRQVADGDLDAAVARLEPRRASGGRACRGCGGRRSSRGPCRASVDDVALADLVARDGDPPAVDRRRGRGARTGGPAARLARPAGAEDDVVEAQLEERSRFSPVTPCWRFASS